MKFLKKLSAMHPERGVKYYLHAQLAKWEPARPIKTIHASALTKTGVEFCPREYALMDLLKIKPANEFVPTATAVTWAQGRLGQDQLVGWLADAGRAVCDWKCAACGTVAKLMKRPPACSTCQCKVLLPIEPRFISLVSGASCGVDTLADLGYPKLRVVEIKTVLKDEFVKLIAPIAEHRLRTNLYLRIIAESGAPFASHIDTERANVLYMCKGGYAADDTIKQWGLKDQAYSPFKEFTISRDDSKTEPYVARSRAVLEWRRGQCGIAGAICSSAIDKRAKSCAVAQACFSGKYPAGQVYAPQEAA